MNAGEIVKAVKTEFRVDVHQVDSATKKVESSFARLSRAAGLVDRGMSKAFRFLTSPVAAFVGFAGVSALTKGLIDAGQAAQDSEMKIASLLLSAEKSSNLIVGGYGNATKAAKALRMEFRALAIESPVGFRDIDEAFGLMSTPLSRAGQSLKEQAKFARDAATREKLEGRGQGIVGMDVQQILNGIGGQRQINTVALKSISEQAAKLAKSGKLAEAAEMIRKALMLSPDELKAFGASYTGTLESLSDQFIMLKETAAKPLMEYLIGKMGEWQTWLEANKEKADEIAKSIGKGVTRAVDLVIRSTKWLASHWDGITTTVKVLAGVWINAKLVGALQSAADMAVKFGANMETAAKHAKMAAGAIAAAQVGSLIGSGINALTGADAVGLMDIMTGNVGSGGLGSAVFGNRMTAAQRDAAVALHARRRAAAVAAGGDADSILDRTVNPSGAVGAGSGTRKVKKLIVERAEFRERDFSRLSAPQLGGTSRRNAVQRPMGGLGLGLAMVGR